MKGSTGRRAAWGLGGGLLAVTAFAVALSSGALPGNNLHAVVPGEIYRSAQPSPDDLRALAEERGLASVLAVRPAQAKKRWYQEEQRAVAELGLVHHSLDFDPNTMPSRALLHELVTRIDEAERPLLLHCRAGVERTGLASTVALLLEGVPPEGAREQFALRYGYLTGFGTTDLPRVIDRYERWLAQAGQSHTPDRFRDWVVTRYVAAFYQAELALTSPPGAVHAGQPIPLGLRVTNRSEEPIVFSAGERGVHVGTRVASLDAERSYARPGRGGFLDHVLEPGASIELDVALDPLPHAGRYRVEVDLVDEGVEWFADMGSRLLVFELEAAPGKVAAGP